MGGDIITKPEAHCTERAGAGTMLFHKLPPGEGGPSPLDHFPRSGR